jgi:peptidoglycan/xylan/chitin deacetylase (PgdA/CDA1 family)
MPTLIPFNLTPNRLKRAGARLLDAAGINGFGFFLQKKLLWPFVRAVNYHVILPEEADSFEKHLRYYGRHYVPGLIVSFDDGHRSHFEIAAPLLEKYNFTGWFFVPIGLMNLEGNRFADRKEEQTAEETALTLEQLQYLDRHHIVGSHTETHCRLRKTVESERLEREICGSQQSFEKVLGHPVASFCWVGGEEDTYSREAADLIKQSYQYSFMTNNAVIRPSENPLQLQRTNIEAENPLWLVRFQLSGLMDIFYAAKRRRVNRLTA